MRRWLIPSDAEGMTAEQWVAEVVTNGDAKAASELIKNGARLNSAPTKPKEKIYEKDIFELYTENTPYAEVSDIVYEDENILAYNKEQDISCYTEKGELAPGLYELAEQHMRETGEYNIQSYTLPYIAHGIDKQTGGIILIAKDEILYRYIAEAMAQRRIKRYYRCIVCGVPAVEHAELHHKLLAKDKFAKVQVVDSESKEGIPVYLRYRQIKTDGKYTLLEIDQVTDHPAQICAQLAYAKLPVLGDAVYGSSRQNRKMAAKLPALWEYRIDFAIGKNNPLEYLDGTTIEAERIKLPYIRGLERGIPGNKPSPQKIRFSNETGIYDF